MKLLKKKEEHKMQEGELSVLKSFIEDGDTSKADELLDYETIGCAISPLLPNKDWSDNHFKPFLNIKIETLQQEETLDNINDRICLELGLYYDSNFNLCIKK